MNKAKQQLLEKKGWKVSTAEDFLGLSLVETQLPHLRDQRLDFLDLLDGRGVLDLVEIPCKLKIEPELRLHSEELLETKCRVRKAEIPASSWFKIGDQVRGMTSQRIDRRDPCLPRS